MSVESTPSEEEDKASLTTSVVLGVLLVEHLVRALQVDRSGELVLEPQLRIQVQGDLQRGNDKSPLGDIHLRVTSRAGENYELASILPMSTSLWRPSVGVCGYRCAISHWEFLRPYRLHRDKRGNVKPCEKIDQFISFYSAYLERDGGTGKGAVVLAFDGADHVAVERYVRNKLPHMKKCGRDVFTVHFSGDDIARWECQKQNIVLQERERALEEMKKAAEEREKVLQGILKTVLVEKKPVDMEKLRTAVRRLRECLSPEQIAWALNISTSEVENILRN